MREWDTTSHCNFCLGCMCNKTVSYANHLTKFKIVSGLLDKEIKEDVLAGEEKTLKDTLKQRNLLNVRKSRSEGGKARLPRSCSSPATTAAGPTTVQARKRGRIPALHSRKIARSATWLDISVHSVTLKIPGSLGKPQKSQSKLRPRPSLQGRWQVCSRS